MACICYTSVSFALSSQTPQEAVTTETGKSPSPYTISDICLTAFDDEPRDMQGNILLVGHASGEVILWEFKRTGWEAVKALKDAHTAPVTSAAFLESSSQLAITGDAKGRLVLHNVTAYLSITSIFAGQSFPQSF